MAVVVNKGTFAKSTGGAPVAQTIDTGSGEEIKFLKLFAVKTTSLGFFGIDVSGSTGFSDGTTEKAVGWFSDNISANKSITSSCSGDKILCFVDGDEVITAEADVTFGTGGDAGKFTVTWTTNDSDADIIHFEAYTGDSITDVKVGEFTSNTSTGNQAVTGVGFQGKYLSLMSASDTSTTMTTANARNAYGQAVSSSARNASCFFLIDNQNKDKDSDFQITDGCLVTLQSGGMDSGDIDGEWDFVSFDADGFTLNVIDDPDNADKIFYAVLNGGEYDVGSFDQPTSTGTDTVTVGFKPKGISLSSWNKVSDTVPAIDSNPIKSSYGAGTESEEGGIWWEHDNDSDADEQNEDINSYTDKVIKLATAESTIDAEADIDSFTATSFVLDWTTADATAREILYFAIGDIFETFTEDFTVDAILSALEEFEVDAFLQDTFDKDFTVDAFLQTTFDEDFTVDAVLKAIFDKDFTVDAFLQATQTFNFTADALLQGEITKFFLTDALLQDSFTEDFDVDSIISSRIPEDFTIDARLVNRNTETFSLDIILEATFSEEFTVDARLSGLAEFKIDGFTTVAGMKNFIISGFRQGTLTETFLVDALIGIPAVTVRQGTFIKDTGGEPVSQTIDTGTNVEIKFIKLSSTRQTSEGFEHITLTISEGFSDGTNSRAISFMSEEGADPTNTGSRYANKGLTFIDSSLSTIAECDVSFGTGVDAGKFTLTWTTNDSVASIINFVTYGDGRETFSANVGTFTSNTSTGNQSITGVGFQGKMSLFLTNNDSTVAPNTVSDGGMCFGHASSSSKRNTVTFLGLNSQGMNNANNISQRTDLALRTLTPTGMSVGNVDADYDFVSFDADGFTLNIIDAPASATQIFYAVLNGGNYDVGDFDQPTSNGTQEITTGFIPIHTCFRSWNEEADIAIKKGVGEMRFTSSGADEENDIEEGGYWFSSDTSSIPTDNDVNTYTDRAILLATGTSTVDAEANYESSNDESFTLDWTVTDATAREILYWTIGEAPTKGFTVDAIVVNRFDEDFTVDAFLQDTFDKDFTVDAKLNRQIIFTIDARLAGIEEFTIDARLAGIEEFTIDAELRPIEEFVIDAELRPIEEFTIDAKLNRQITFTIDARLAGIEEFTIDARLAGIEEFTIDSRLVNRNTETFDIDAFVQAEQVFNFTIDGLIQNSPEEMFLIDAFVQETFTEDFTIDAFPQAQKTETFIIDAEIRPIQEFSIDAKIVRIKLFTIDAELRPIKEFTVDAELNRQIIFTIDAELRPIQEFIIDAEIRPIKEFTIDAELRPIQEFIIDAELRPIQEFTIDAKLNRQVIFEIDAKLNRQIIFTVDAKINRQIIFTVDAKLNRQSVFTIDAFPQATFTEDFTIDSRLIAMPTEIFDIDAILLAIQTEAFTIDSIIDDPDAVTEDFTINALLEAVQTKAFDIDALLLQEQTETFAIDAQLIQGAQKAFLVDAFLQDTQTEIFDIDSFLILQQTKDFTVNALLLATQTLNFTIDATIVTLNTKIFAVDALLEDTFTEDFTVDGSVVNRNDKDFKIDARLSQLKTFKIDALVFFTRAFSIGAKLKFTLTETFTIDAITFIPPARPFAIDAVLIDRNTEDLEIDALLETVNTKDFTIDSLLQITNTKDFTVDAKVVEGATKDFEVDALLVDRNTKDFIIDTLISKVIVTGFFIDARIILFAQEDFTVNAIVNKTQTEDFTIDARIKLEGMEVFTVDAFLRETFTATPTINAIVVDRNTEDFTIDAFLQELGQTKDFTINGIIKALGQTENFAISGVLFIVPSITIQVDAQLALLAQTKSFIIDASLVDRFTEDLTINAVLVRTESFTIDALKQITIENDPFFIDAVLSGAQTPVNFTIDSLIDPTFARNSLVDSILVGTKLPFEVDSLIQQQGVTKDFTIDGFIQPSIMFTIDSILIDAPSASFLIDSQIMLPAHFTIDGFIQLEQAEAVEVDARLVRVEKFTIDALVKALGETRCAGETTFEERFGDNSGWSGEINKPSACEGAGDQCWNKKRMFIPPEASSIEGKFRWISIRGGGYFATKNPPAVFKEKYRSIFLQDGDIGGIGQIKGTNYKVEFELRPTSPISSPVHWVSLTQNNIHPEGLSSPVTGDPGAVFEVFGFISSLTLSLRDGLGNKVSTTLPDSIPTFTTTYLSAEKIGSIIRLIAYSDEDRTIVLTQSPDVNIGVVDDNIPMFYAMSANNKRAGPDRFTSGTMDNIIIRSSPCPSVRIDSFVQQQDNLAPFLIDAKLNRQVQVQVDAIVFETPTEEFTISAKVIVRQTKDFTIDALFSPQKSFTIDAVISDQPFENFFIDARLVHIGTGNFGNACITGSEQAGEMGVTPQGVVYMITQACSGGIIMTKSLDNGITWSGSLDDANRPSDPADTAPAIAVSNITERINVLWVRNKIGGTMLFTEFNTMTDKWDTPFLVVSSTFSAVSPNPSCTISKDANGEAHIAYATEGFLNYANGIGGFGGGITIGAWPQGGGGLLGGGLSFLLGGGSGGFGSGGGGTGGAGGTPMFVGTNDLGELTLFVADANDPTGFASFIIFTGVEFVSGSCANLSFDTQGNAYVSFKDAGGLQIGFLSASDVGAGNFSSGFWGSGGLGGGGSGSGFGAGTLGFNGNDGFFMSVNSDGSLGIWSNTDAFNDPTGGWGTPTEPYQQFTPNQTSLPNMNWQQFFNNTQGDQAHVIVIDEFAQDAVDIPIEFSEEFANSVITTINAIVDHHQSFFIDAKLIQDGRTFEFSIDATLQGQVGIPIEDIANQGSWEDVTFGDGQDTLFNEVDDTDHVPDDDITAIKSKQELTISDTAELKIIPLIDPGTDVGINIRFRARATGDNYLMKAQLYQGGINGTFIAETPFFLMTDEYQEFRHPLTTPQASLITDFADLTIVLVPLKMGNFSIDAVIVP